MSARDAVRSRWGQTGSQSVPPVKKKTEKAEIEETVSCPVCSRKFSPSTINTHLDSCLTSPEEEKVEEVEESLNDGEDEALLAAVMELENSTTASPTTSPVIVLSDDSEDSDDEPLVKRKSGERFNDVMAEQDDQDILAALETTGGCEEEAEQSMFACPICDELLCHREMFSHLDICTKNI